jgi:hypothetical protein
LLFLEFALGPLFFTALLYSGILRSSRSYSLLFRAIISRLSFNYDPDLLRLFQDLEILAEY